ncbi:hypothetical protein V2G26_003393 [Clonostachys chloroleuca]
MGSSRASTPASGRESPEPLTPRSKIKALLAAVDNSDDEASGPQISKILQGLFSRPNNLGSTQETDATDEESDEEIRPRGRLAARMHAAAASTEERKPATETRYQPESNVQEDIDMTQPQGDDEDEDDILPVAPRRLVRRTAQDGGPRQKMLLLHVLQAPVYLYLPRHDHPLPRAKAMYRIPRNFYQLSNPIGSRPL